MVARANDPRIDQPNKSQLRLRPTKTFGSWGSSSLSSKPPKHNGFRHSLSSAAEQTCEERSFKLTICLNLSELAEICDILRTSTTILVIGSSRKRPKSVLIISVLPMIRLFGPLWLTVPGTARTPAARTRSDPPRHRLYHFQTLATNARNTPDT